MIPDTTRATRELADGNEMPLLGLGVWQVPDGPECVNAVRWALELGYRHIDTAQAYRNESSVGKALKDSGVDRNEVFITTKFLPRAKDPAAEAEQSLRRLGVDQVDLYVVHWPGGGPTWAWPGMERARELGYARSIGVSNFGVAELDSVAAIATVMPAVNQVNFNPSAFRRALLDACQRHGVVLEAYSRWAPGASCRTPPSALSPPAWAGRRPRCCCAGACSGVCRCCRSRPAGTGSRRTAGSSASS